MYATSEHQQRPEGARTTYLEDLSDAELTRKVKSGSDDALSALLRRHRDPLYRFCLHLMRDPHDAEDVCQETLARAIVRVDSLQAGSAFRGWLFSIARNLSVDSYRSRKRVCPIPDEEITALPPPLCQESPYDRLEISEEYQTVAQAMSRLKKNHQTVLMLREVEGLSYAEIARQLDVSESAVETLLFRARRRLREEYTRADAPAPVFGWCPLGLAGLRGLFHRLASPIQRFALPPIEGAPLTARVAVSAVAIGLAIVTAPRVVPILHTSSGESTGRAPIVAARPLVAPVSGSTSARMHARGSGSPGSIGFKHSARARTASAGTDGSGRVRRVGTIRLASAPFGKGASRHASGAIGTAGSSRATGKGTAKILSPTSQQTVASMHGGRHAGQGSLLRFGGAHGHGTQRVPARYTGASTARGTRSTLTPPASGHIRATHRAAGSTGAVTTPASPTGKTPAGSGGATFAPQPVAGQAVAAASQAQGQVQAAASAAQTEVSAAPAQMQTSVAGAASQGQAQVNATVRGAQSQAANAVGPARGKVNAAASGAGAAVSQAAGQVTGATGQVKGAAKGTAPPVKKPTVTVTPVPTTVSPPVTVPPVKKTLPPVPTPVPIHLKP